MAVERATSGSSLIDVLDRVLDKGIVIDAWVRVSLVGIDLITVEARVVVASIDTYLKYSEAVGTVAPVAKPDAMRLNGGGAKLAPTPQTKLAFVEALLASDTLVEAAQLGVEWMARHIG